MTLALLLYYLCILLNILSYLSYTVICLCCRIWGINCGTSDKYGSYRNMYLQRPHLRFNGLYHISYITI